MKNRIIYLIGLCLVFAFSCVEELDVISTVEAGYEDVLVVEATITDEMKTQTVLLSRAYRLEDDGPLLESNAQIRVIGDNGDIIEFQEIQAGKYESITQFAAQDQVEYILEIRTSDNLVFESEKTKLSGDSNIDDIYFERDFNENEEEGVSLYVDSYDPTGRAKYYKYTYEETFKIIAPRYNAVDLRYTRTFNALGIPMVTYFFVPKEEQQQICYSTVNSNDINITSAAGLSSNDIDMYRVRFLSRLNPIITHRYSILVRQYVQSSEAYTYYETLASLSDSNSLLSQTQPGFLNGNLFSTTNSDKKVAGYFEVSSVDERRLYFNYADLFPGEGPPPYFESCVLFAPLESRGMPPVSFPLADGIDQGIKYYSSNDNPIQGEGAYYMVVPICGDCTVMGNNYPPDFWEE